MNTDSAEVLPYAGRTSRQGRFRHLLVMFPFSVGLGVGGSLAGVIAICAPDFVAFGFWPVVLAFGLGVVGASALGILFLFGCFSPNPRVACDWPIAVMVGIAAPVVCTVVAISLQVIRIVTSPPAWFDGLSSYLLLGCCGLFALGSPFVLMQWGRSSRPKELRRARTWSIVTVFAVAAVVLAMMLAVGRRWAQSAYDHQCEQLAGWVKATYHAAGTYGNIPLPAAQRALADDTVFDAVITVDGRTVIMLKTEQGFHHNWCGVIYSTGPIAPGEIGPDYWGGTQIHIPGLPFHSIGRQRDSQHFTVYSNID